MEGLELVEITKEDFDYLKSNHYATKKVQVFDGKNFAENAVAILSIVETKDNNDGEKYALIDASDGVGNKYYKLVVK